MDEIRLIGNIESNINGEQCHEVVALCEEIRYEFKDAELRLEISPNLPLHRIPMSCEKFRRLLDNLIKNAVSFSPGRGSVSPSLETTDDSLVVSVRDRGPGIPEEVFCDIVDRFFSYRRDRKGKHSGLGLSIVDAIVRGCGGRLDYRNRTEGGAEFTCTIPFLRA